MSTVANSQTPPPAPEKEDPWRVGWRYVPRKQADGQTRFEQVPLSEDDLLHPQEEDFVVNNKAHVEICTYLRNALAVHFADKPEVAALHDCRVDWGVDGVQPLGPDFSVFDEVRAPWDPMQGTFCVAALNARPLLAIEVTSPSTRNIDLDDTVDLYFRAGIPLYVIVDLRPGKDGSTEIRLIGHRRGVAVDEGYIRMRPNDRGWLWLDTIQLWLAPERQAVACYDANGRRLKDHVEAVCSGEQAERRAEAAEIRAATNAVALEGAELRIKQLEAELQRLRGNDGGAANPPS